MIAGGLSLYAHVLPPASHGGKFEEAGVCWMDFSGIPCQYPYWTYEKGVKNCAKLFRLTLGFTRESGLSGALKPKGVNVKEDCGRVPRVLAISRFPLGTAS